MGFKEELKIKFDQEETRTVSDSFGGPKLQGKAPNYSLSGIAIFIEKYDYGEPEKHLGSQLALLRKKMVKQQYHYIITSLVRFAFLIELTNLKITSTKLKTKWVPGDCVESDQFGSFELNK